ncbi:MAG TPA: hypothetical protein VL137_15360 [Polyangiaceae bacterium]|jgi:hypothetical protein|nr:hypothetical protein [Polyangiaceae bacterium]
MFQSKFARVISCVAFIGFTLGTPAAIAKSKHDKAAEKAATEKAAAEKAAADKAAAEQAAAEKAAAEQAAAEKAAADKAAAEQAAADKAAADKAAADKAAADRSPVEEDGKTYRFVGLRYRGIILPKFVLSAFVEGGKTLYINGIGPEFTIRKDGMEFNLSSWLAFYSMGDTLMKGKKDPIDAWEIDSANLKLWYFTVDLLGSHELKPGLSLVYGGGAGLAAVFGTVTRSEITPPGGNPNLPLDQWVKCTGPAVNTFCSKDAVLNKSEPSWINGGDKPVVFPWLALQTGLRYKPTRHFVARLDLGISLSGFFFGLAGDYGL